MATIAIDFTPPDISGIVALRIYESATKEGSYAQIERVTDIGEFPTYISRYTTMAASSATDWFKIAWEDAGGAITIESVPVQGGTTTLIATLVNRVMLRDAFLNEAVVAQVAEAVVASVMQTEDPYDTSLTATYDQLEGMTLLILARSNMHMIMTTASESDSYTAGLISIKSSSNTKSQTSTDLIRWLIDEANRLLGLNYSAIMLMDDISIGGAVSAWENDSSRLLVNVYNYT